MVHFLKSVVHAHLHSILPLYVVYHISQRRIALRAKLFTQGG